MSNSCNSYNSYKYSSNLLIFLFTIIFSTVQPVPAAAQTYNYDSYNNRALRYSSGRDSNPIVRSYFDDGREVPTTGYNPHSQSMLINQAQFNQAQFSQSQFNQARLASPTYAHGGSRVSAFNLASPRVMSFTPQVSPAIDGQCEQMLSSLESEHLSAARDRSSLVKRQLDFYQSQLRSDIAAVPKYSYDAKGRKISNPDYSSIVDGLNAAYNNKISAVGFEADRNSAELDDYYAKRMKGVIASRESISEQMVSHSGNTKMVETGTNMYVHNYVNFGGSLDNSASSSLAQHKAPAPLPQALLAVTRKLK